MGMTAIGTEGPFTIRKELSFGELTVRISRIGEDTLITVTGGQAHIGSCVLAVPRPSLADPSVTSCTSSVLNVTGHEDEKLCRSLAEAVCRSTGRTAVCTGGFHKDGITKEQIREVLLAVEEILQVPGKIE